MSPAAAGRTDTAPSRSAVLAAYAVPPCVLPSAIWRLSVSDGSAPGWYVMALSVVSMALALSTLGLVHGWGERLPRWVPRIGGRRVPPRPVLVAAMLTGWSLIAVCVYFFVNRHFHLVAHGWSPAGDHGPLHDPPGWEVLRYYAPLVAWGPLVLIVAADYRRRVAAVPAGAWAGPHV